MVVTKYIILKHLLDITKSAHDFSYIISQQVLERSNVIVTILLIGN